MKLLVSVKNMPAKFAEGLQRAMAMRNELEALFLVYRYETSSSAYNCNPEIKGLYVIPFMRKNGLFVHFAY